MRESRLSELSLLVGRYEADKLALLEVQLLIVSPLDLNLIRSCNINISLICLSISFFDLTQRHEDY